jgi:hypothetical protein
MGYYAINYYQITNHDMQLEIDCIEWALQKIEVDKLPNGSLTF